MNGMEYLNVTRNESHISFSYRHVNYNISSLYELQLGVIEHFKKPDVDFHSICIIPKTNLIKCEHYYYHYMYQGTTHNTTSIEEYSKVQIKLFFKNNFHILKYKL